MSRRIVFSLIAILLAIGVVGGGAFAWFSDVEEVGQNVITAGTLNLQVGADDPCTEHIELSNLPCTGGEYATIIWKIANTGSLPGKLSVEFSDITNNDNGCNEPECLAEGGTWDGTSCTGDCGDDEGELGEYLRVAMGYPGDDLYFVPWKVLNNHGGQTYTATSVLEGGKTTDFYFRYDVRGLGNIVQSDSVEFDITFYLNQTL